VAFVAGNHNQRLQYKVHLVDERARAGQRNDGTPIGRLGPTHRPLDCRDETPS
jgi:hypothetical protein